MQYAMKTYYRSSIYIMYLIVKLHCNMQIFKKVQIMLILRNVGHPWLSRHSYILQMCTCWTPILSRVHPWPAAVVSRVLCTCQLTVVKKFPTIKLGKYHLYWMESTKQKDLEIYMSLCFFQSILIVKLHWELQIFKKGTSNAYSLKCMWLMFLELQVSRSHRAPLV